MALLYIHKATCVSPQHTFDDIDLNEVKHPVHNELQVNEPAYKGIPAGALRRMGKAIRMGVGAAMPLLKDENPAGIIIGTANGGMEDCIKFLNQIIDYNEGMLTPGNFVGSTPNAIAAQLGLVTKNKNYNITHVQSGLSFENALLDAAMMLHDHSSDQYLVGGVDEISEYNYNIDWLSGWYKKEDYDGDFYAANTTGSLAGEGAAMFMVDASKENALAAVDAMHFFHSDDATEIAQELEAFLSEKLGADIYPDLFLTGENGDSRYLNYYSITEALFPETTCISRYKHFSGEYPTSSAIAAWLAVQFIQAQKVPNHFIKKNAANAIKTILIYNHYKASQHSFMLLSLPV